MGAQFNSSKKPSEAEQVAVAKKLEECVEKQWRGAKAKKKTDG